MIVVADTSALNYLILMQRADLLRELYGGVVLPHAVREEMLSPGAPPEVIAWSAELPAWAHSVSPLRVDPTLPDQLGNGEREAISLALEMSADVVLMDDQRGRTAAESRGLFVSGTLSVLLQASRLELLEFEPAMQELRRLGFRMSLSVEGSMRRLSRSGNKQK